MNEWGTELFHPTVLCPKNNSSSPHCRRIVVVVGGCGDTILGNGIMRVRFYSNLFLSGLYLIFSLQLMSAACCTDMQICSQ